jgi:hypothetical protein
MTPEATFARPSAGPRGEGAFPQVRKLSLVELGTHFDEVLHPASELIILYHERWEEDQVFDEQKTHQDPRRATKPAHLRRRDSGRSQGTAKDQEPPGPRSLEHRVDGILSRARTRTLQQTGYNDEVTFLPCDDGREREASVLPLHRKEHTKEERRPDVGFIWIEVTPPTSMPWIG